MDAARYVKPRRATNLFDESVARLARLGISMWGARILYVRGRKSGQRRATPVNLLTYQGERYLVAPRGNTQWVRNLRAAGAGELRLGRRVEQITPIELADADKPAVLRAYLKRWKFEVGAFFDGVGPEASDEQLLRIASGYPIFRLTAGQER